MNGTFTGAKVEVVLNVLGEEKQAKMSFSDLKESTTEEQLKQVALLFTTLTPETHELSHFNHSVTTHYTI